MFSLFFSASAPAADHDQEETLGYEWAEYNLPVAADMDALRQLNKTCAAREVLS